MSADLGFAAIFLILSSIFSFFRPLPSELTERNSTKTGHMRGSECDLIVLVRNLGHSLPLKIGAQNQIFDYFTTQRQLQPPITPETQRRLSKCVDNYEGSPTSSQNVVNFGPQTAYNWTCTFYAHPPYKFCILICCMQALQTEIS